MFFSWTKMQNFIMNLLAFFGFVQSLLSEGYQWGRFVVILDDFRMENSKNFRKTYLKELYFHFFSQKLLFHN